MTDETQPKRSFLRKTMRGIPLVGLVDYVVSGDAGRDGRMGMNIRLVKHLANSVVTPVVLTLLYLTANYDGPTISDAHAAMEQKYRKQQTNSQRVYDDLCDQLFGTNGLADVNTNGVVEPRELLDAFSRCGMLRLPSESDLRRGIDSYKK